MAGKVTLSEKFALFNEHWTPKIIGESNGAYIKFFKALGEFIWHSHENEDELFQVIKGTLYIKFRDDEVELNEGDLYIIPKRC